MKVFFCCCCFFWQLFSFHVLLLVICLWSQELSYLSLTQIRERNIMKRFPILRWPAKTHTCQWDWCWAMLWLPVNIWIKTGWGHWYQCFSRGLCWSGEIYLFTCEKLLSRDLISHHFQTVTFDSSWENWLSEFHFRAMTHMACLFSSASSHSASSFFKTLLFSFYPRSYF